jgi:hypothetical protein
MFKWISGLFGKAELPTVKEVTSFAGTVEIGDRLMMVAGDDRTGLVYFFNFRVYQSEDFIKPIDWKDATVVKRVRETPSVSLDLFMLTPDGTPVSSLLFDSNAQYNEIKIKLREDTYRVTMKNVKAEVIDDKKGHWRFTSDEAVIIEDEKFDKWLEQTGWIKDDGSIKSVEELQEECGCDECYMAMYPEVRE